MNISKWVEVPMEGTVRLNCCGWTGVPITAIIVDKLFKLKHKSTRAFSRLILMHNKSQIVMVSAKLVEKDNGEYFLSEDARYQNGKWVKTWHLEPRKYDKLLENDTNR